MAKDRAVSRLARALWIEIGAFKSMAHTPLSRGSREPCGLKFSTAMETEGIFASRLARALWIEILNMILCGYFTESRLARALWIEISAAVSRSHRAFVEARESLVD